MLNLSRITGLSACLCLLSMACGGGARGNQVDVAEVVEWTSGEGTRLGAMPTPQTYMLLAPPGQLSTRPHGACTATSSLLPAPAGDSRVFTINDGQLHETSAPSASAKKLTGGDSVVVLKGLLAFQSASSPLKLVALARVQGQDVDSLWLVTVGPTTIIEESSLTSDEALVDRESFFRKYSAPRCKAAGAECLVIQTVNGQCSIDVESQRGAARTKLISLDAMTAIDAAWEPGGKSVYLLVRCN